MPLQPMLKAAGLATADNPHSAIPEGGLVKAQNCVLRYRHIPEPRRGQDFMRRDGVPIRLADDTERTNEGVWYQGELVCHHGTDKLGTAYGTAVDGGGNPIFADYAGSYTPADAAMLRMKFLEAAGNLYFNTNAGIYFLESLTGAVAKAGVPAAWDDFYADTALVARVVGDAGWMATDTAVAYRYTWAIKDSHDNLKEGAPSGRFVVKNKLVSPATGVARVTNVVTVTFGEAHAYVVTDIVTLLNPAATFGAGPHTITAVTQFTIEYAETAANDTSAVALEYAADSNVSLAPRIPPGITTSHFLRVWRSKQMPDADIEPLDEVFLVKEKFPTAAEISTGYMTLTDITPDSQLDVPAYFNANSGDGPIQNTAKYRPPIGKDFLYWDNRAWCLNTTDKHRFHLRLLGIGSPDGVQNNDTVTIGGQTFTAKSSGGNYASFEFSAYNGTLGAYRNIELAARSLVACINHNSASLAFIAFYESDGRAPGKILIEEKDIGGSGFGVWASRPASWGPAIGASPYASGTFTFASAVVADLLTLDNIVFEGVAGAALPGEATFSIDTDDTATAASFVTQVLAFPWPPAYSFSATSNMGVATITVSNEGPSGNIIGIIGHSATITTSGATLTGGYTTEHSENDRREGGGSFSERNEPESFPLLNFKDIAPKGVEILRGIGFRDRMYCFAENGKAYVVTAAGDSYISTEIDGSALLLAPDSVRVHANQVFAFTDQGVGILTDAGFRIVSRGVESGKEVSEGAILRVLSLPVADIRRLTYAVSYESERQYQLWLPDPLSNGDLHASVGYIYNSMDSNWAIWLRPSNWGGVGPNGKLYLGDAEEDRVREERKSFNRTDYADEAAAVTIDAQAGDVLTITSPDLELTPGDMIVQGGVRALLLDEGGTIYPADAVFTPGAATVYAGYEVSVKWAPMALGNPRQMKTWRDVTFHFREYFCWLMRADFDTEEVISDDSADIVGAARFGELINPDADASLPLGLRNRNVSVTDNHKNAAMLRVGVSIREAFALWGLHGFTPAIETAGEKSRS